MGIGDDIGLGCWGFLVRCCGDDIFVVILGEVVVVVEE